QGRGPDLGGAQGRPRDRLLPSRKAAQSRSAAVHGICRELLPGQDPCRLRRLDTSGRDRGLVSWFRNSLHYRGESFIRISEPNDTRLLSLLASFESEVRSRGYPQGRANFGFGTLAHVPEKRTAVFRTRHAPTKSCDFAAETRG